MTVYYRKNDPRVATLTLPEAGNQVESACLIALCVAVVGANIAFIVSYLRSAGKLRRELKSKPVTAP